MSACLACREEAPEAPIPASEYTKPEAPPSYAAAPDAAVQKIAFADVTVEAGIDFMHVTGAFGQKWMPETTGGGGALFDYDGDGHTDVLLVNSGYWPGHEPERAKATSRLYRHRGDKLAFEDVTEMSGLSRLSCYGMGAAIADYDGDGDDDIYVTAVGANHLLRNDAGKFVDVTKQAGVAYSKDAEKGSPWEWSTGSVWVDYDRDGDLDLFVANYVRWTPETDLWATLDGTNKSYASPQQYEGTTCTMFRNEGGTSGPRFVDVTEEAGLLNPAGKSLSVVADDFNDDGWPDLVVTNDTQPNFLYVNNRDGTFKDEALLAGVAYDENGLARAGMGVSVTDVSNSGVRAIAIGNFSGEPLSLYTQAGGGTFIDRAGATRVAKETTAVLTFGVQFADLNLDGYEDLVLANGHIEPDIAKVKEGVTFAQPVQFFVNNRQGRFVEVSESTGTAAAAPMVGRCAATADLDDDGDLDVLLTANGDRPRLLRNDTVSAGKAVRVRLQQDGHNRTAIGARLTATIGEMRVVRYVTRGGSYLSQSELTATFGLGEADKIDHLTIRWPDGTAQQIDKLPAGATYTIDHTNGVTTRDSFR